MGFITLQKKLPVEWDTLEKLEGFCLCPLFKEVVEAVVDSLLGDS